MATLTMLSKQISDHDKLINYLLIGYAFMLPISKAGVNTFEALILLTWFIQGDWGNKLKLYKNNLLIKSISALILLSIISIPFASSTSFALEYILKYKHLLIILPIFSSLDTKYIKHIFSAFLMGIFLSEIMSYGIFFELWSYKNISPSNPSPFLGRVDYSVYLSFASIILLTRIINEINISFKLRLGYIFFFLTSTASLFINTGRTGQVTFVIIVIVSFVMSFERKIRASITSIALLAGILITSYILSTNFYARANDAVDDVQKIIYQSDYSRGIGQRVSLWIVGFDKIQDNLLIGKGIGNELKDREKYIIKRGFHNPNDTLVHGDYHNMFLTIGLQIGIFGLTILLIIFYSILILKFRSKEYKILNLAFIVAFFLWSLGNTTLHTMNPMVFFALFAGLFNKISDIELPNKSTLKAEDNPISIKYYVKNFFLREQHRFTGKKIVDFPAGNGVTSKIIQNIGATPLPYDLFPEYFKVENLKCQRANINQGIPLNDEAVDSIISQEGIEHFENQLFALREFNRILKPHGSLIITTPNASNMVGKLSYFLSENELFNKMMPQNELDDIWMSNQKISSEIYYGHIFLIGVNKLRLLAKLSGFKIKNIEKTRIKSTAAIIFILFYPFILFSNWISYHRNLRKNKDFSMEVKKEIYGEIFKLSISPKLLTSSHIFIEFEKYYEVSKVRESLPSKHKEFGMT